MSLTSCKSSNVWRTVLSTALTLAVKKFKDSAKTKAESSLARLASVLVK